MKWSSAVSDRELLEDALAECVAKVLGELDGQTPDLILAFISTHHMPGYMLVPGLIRELLGDGLLIGCSGGGVIGDGSEVEHRPGLALSTAVLPGVQLSSFHLENDELPDADAPPNAWEAAVGTNAADSPQFILIADPFSIDGDGLLMGLDYAFPDSVKIGGLASGASQPNGNALFLGESVHRSGAIGVALHGDIVVDTIVAQGCRPIGIPMRVTACNQGLLMGLDDKPPLEVLGELVAELDERDQHLVRHSLFLGIVMDELNDSPQQGDFLIRNVVGADQEKGILAIGQLLEEGQTVQFHLRDADTATQDLDVMLDRYAARHPIHEEAGGLLFSCLGRGSYLFGRPDHDTDLFREKVGNIPLAGFFCNGEIGPVGGATFLHGYTSSFGIFRPARSE